ncbi:hypothetical protein U1Q18_000239 [Sarracenia purpurea var. burkii]
MVKLSHALPPRVIDVVCALFAVECCCLVLLLKEVYCSPHWLWSWLAVIRQLCRQELVCELFLGLFLIPIEQIRGVLLCSRLGALCIVVLI